MTEFLESITLFPLLLTLGTYQIGVFCQKKTKSALCNPLLIATLLSIGVLLLTDFDLTVYQSGSSWITWLLTPATVSLAVPLYTQLKVFKDELGAILVGVAAGTVASMGFILLACGLLQLDRVLTVSMLPKSITTAIGLILSQEAGGIPALTSAAIVITGILGNLTGSFLCKVLKITDPIAQGVGFGTASHVIGTSRATEVDPLAGAVSSLSLAVAGILTALVFPLVLMLL
ncbi:MAG: LrgB family protein [Oscillospiraceae bacterium]|nr:LrgB family protein [Oscillospiraceae bacterium]